MLKRAVIIIMIIFMNSSEALNAAEKRITITHKSAAAKSARQFFATTVFVAVYGEVLPVLEEKEGWAKVRKDEKEGWVHSSSTVKGRVNTVAKPISKSSQSGGAYQADVALAGKGFSGEAEKSYKKSNNGADYASVDLMEQWGISDEELLEFANEGNLKSE